MVLVIEYLVMVYFIQDEYEYLAICPVAASAIMFLIYINAFRRSTADNLALLEDDYVVSAETAWIISVAMTNLVQSV